MDLGRTSDEESSTFRCPVSGCVGWVDLVEDEDGDFWGCGECGSIWRKKKNLMAEITQIIKKRSYRQACYAKAGRGWKPADQDDEPEDYETLVEQESPDATDGFERG
jgi:hypothetical protein